MQFWNHIKLHIMAKGSRSFRLGSDKATALKLTNAHQARNWSHGSFWARPLCAVTSGGRSKGLS